MFEILSALAALILSAGAAKVKHAATPTRRHLRAARRGVGQLRRSGRRLSRIFAKLRKRLARAAKPLRAHRLRERLQTTPLQDLKAESDGSVRWSALEAEGIENLATLEQQSVADLVKIDGIGEVTAQRSLHALKKFKEKVGSESLLAPEAELEEPGALATARESLHLAEVQRIAGPTLAQIEGRVLALQESSKKAHQAGGFWRWLFRPSARAEAEVAATTQLEAVKQAVEQWVPAAVRVEAEALARSKEKVDVKAAYRERFAECAAAIEQATSAQPGKRAGRSSLDLETSLDAATQSAIENTALSPHVMNIGLRGYQQFGSKFLLNQHRTLLGDEMGLGKTIQALAAMAQLWADRGRAHFLVVAPASLLLNWKSEVLDKTRLTPFVAHGSAREAHTLAWAKHGGVLMVSYSTLRTYSPLAVTGDRIERIDMLIADEAHYIKNPKSGRTQAVVELLENSDRVCFLTGTPMENHPREFEHLIGLLKPRLQGQLSQLGLAEVDLNEPEDAGLAARFRAAVAPVYLRRNQEDVLQELPDLIEVNEWVSPTAEELRRYAEAVEKGAIMTMRRVASAPDGDGASSKLARLAELLAEHREEGRKTIVFSYFIDVLDGVAQQHDHVGIIRGGQTPEQRQQVLDRFSSSDQPELLLAQIVAAGQGLNLQAASAIVLFEPQFTPSAEAQAIARAYRMGQTRKVLVHRLLAAETIDERLVELLGSKTTLFDDYARHSLTAEFNPAATETQLVKVLIQKERERLAR